MYPEVNSQASRLFAVRKKPSGQDINGNPNLATDGFNIWWQKTVSQNMAMLAEASDLMRMPRPVNSACQPRARQAR
jgi:hypothetical protein